MRRCKIGRGRGRIEEWLKGVAAFKKQTELYPYKNGAKVQPHQPSVLTVYLTQMLKLRF